MPITPNPPADFTPVQGNYKELKPFRYWCQKVLPLVYDDSLSYYELLCKVVDYLNKTMEDVDTLHDDVDNLHTAYVALQTYVNNYFATLDVQQEINNKLDIMAEDGTLTSLIMPFIPDAVASDIDSMVTSGEFGDIVNSYVPSAVSSKINTMVSDGSFNSITDPKVIEETDTWLSSHISNPSNPPLDTSLTLSNACAPAKTVGDNAFLIRTAPNDTVTLASIREIGIYGISATLLANITDAPSNIQSAVSTLINYKGAYGGITIQRFMQLNGKVHERLIVSSNGNVFQDWRRIDSVTCFRALEVPSTATHISDLRTMGLYHFNASALADFDDLPSDIETVMTTLFNYSNAYNQESYVIQRLTQFEKVWERTIIATGVVYKDWKRIDVGTSFVARTTPNDTTTLASIREMGVYAIPKAVLSNITDAPSNIQNAVSTLMNYTDTYGGITIQRFMQLNNKIHERLIISSTGAVYADWHRIDTVTCFRALEVPSTATLISDLRTMGLYHFNASHLANYSDLPEDVGSSMATLLNYTNAYNQESYIIQRFMQFEKIWERTIIATGVVYKDWERIDKFNTPLGSKVLTTAGDSYTSATFSGQYAEYNGKNFGYYIAKRNHMTFNNRGISGSTMAVPSDGSTDREPFSDTRYQNIPADTDFLTLWFGINDSAHCTLGTIDDETNETFYGAWNVVLKYYLTNRPFMKILIIITGHTSATWNNAIRECASKWGYPVLDLEKNHLIPAMFGNDSMSIEARNLRRNAYGWNDFNGHPNPQWHEFYSNVIEQYLLTS